jgi:tRNA(Arg) A34 adenosine deaminase TadA
MKQAIMEARKSPLRIKHGCIIVNRGTIVGYGRNTYSSQFKGGSSTHSLHAEIDAINNIPRYLLWDAEIYIVRICIDEGHIIQLGNSHPCSDCTKKLAKFKKYRIKVYYSMSMQLLL